MKVWTRLFIAQSPLHSSWLLGWRLSWNLGSWWHRRGGLVGGPLLGATLVGTLLVGTAYVVGDLVDARR
jgi:hypothetical protein